MTTPEGYRTDGLPEDAIMQGWRSMIVSAPMVTRKGVTEIEYFDMKFVKLGKGGSIDVRAEGFGSTAEECWESRSITWESSRD